jgi:hypothetical protein
MSTWADWPKPHGSATRYRAGCRCDDCRSAHTARIARQRWRRGVGRRHPEGRYDWHGRASCYNSGCGHAACRAVAAERRRLARAQARKARG